MNFVVRITGPGIDHQVMVNSLEDFQALELIILKVRRHFEAETSDKPATGQFDAPLPCECMGADCIKYSDLRLNEPMYYCVKDRAGRSVSSRYPSKIKGKQT